MIGRENPTLQLQRLEKIVNHNLGNISHSAAVCRQDAQQRINKLFRAMGTNGA